ncbi:MAG: hypothetical protein RJB61_508 [Actinomycetota bacterium]
MRTADSRPRRLRAGLAGLVAALAAAAAVSTAVPSPVGAATCVMCAGGEYHPLSTPVRIFDSRPASASNPTAPINDVAPLGPKPINLTTGGTVQRFNVQLLGLRPNGTEDPAFENPWIGPFKATAADVLAVVLNIAVVQPGSRGYLSAWPAGTTPLTPSSTLNFDAGQTTSNMALARPGTDGQFVIDLRGSVASTAHLIIDVQGWYSTSLYLGEDGIESTDERGGRTITVSPGRILDTRPTNVGPGSVTELVIRGASTIDATPLEIVPDRPTVKAVVLNVAVDRPTANTYVTVVPEAPAGPPPTSTVNVSAGATRSSMAVVRIADDGKIRIYNNAGTTRIVVDVLGYIEDVPDETRVGRVVPISSPFRAFDTRRVEFGRVPLGPGQSEEWSFAAFAASVNVAGVSVGNQSGFIANLTNASLVRQYPTVPVRSNLRVYPSVGTSTAPLVSHLNSAEGSAIANLTVVSYGTSERVWVLNAAGYAHYLVDIAAVILAD